MREVITLKKNQVYYEDVAEGDAIPELVKKYELFKWVAFLTVHGDFYGAHFDYRSAEKQKDETAPSPHGFGMQVMTHLSQLLTDWMGPNGVLKTFKCKTRAPIYDGTINTYRGKIVKKYIENGENFVELELDGIQEDGKLGANGYAKVILPSRKTV